MADNPIFIVNTYTKKYICIVKRLSGPWRAIDATKNLNLLFDDEENQESFWENENCYEIMYENDEAFYK